VSYEDDDAAQMAEAVRLDKKETAEMGGIMHAIQACLDE